jgi:transposase
MYLGKLTKLAEADYPLLLKRIQQLLVGQYHGVSSEEVERLAIKYVGQLRANQEGNIKGGERVEVEGGLLTEQKLARIDLSSYQPISALEGGGAWLCHQVINLLGIPSFLENENKWTASEIEWMLLNLQGRLLHPSSERATALWVEERSSVKGLMSEVQRVHDDGLRASALNWWSIHQPLEDYLYERLSGLLEFDSLRYLYDLTNTYFEGRMLGSTLAQYGRSKEKRSDAPLVSIGLLTNELGFIRRSHFYSGNVSEPGTLENVYEFLENSPGVVTDAGIGTAANVEEMVIRQIPYMCVVREGFKEYEIDFEQGEHFIHKTSNGKEYGVWLQSREHQFMVEQKSYTDWLIFVKSEAKQAKEDSMIAKQKTRFEIGLAAIAESLTKARGHKSIARVHQRIGRLKSKNTRVSKAFDIQVTDDNKNVTSLIWTYDSTYEKRNGTYIIRRSAPITDLKEAWKDYCSLSEIEAVNRCCKTDLNLRPVYHQKDEAIQAHLFLTLIACTIVQFIRHQLAKHNIRWSWKEIVRIMDTQKVVNSQFTNDQKEWFLLSNWSLPDTKTKEIYDALNLDYQPIAGFFFKITPKSP